MILNGSAAHVLTLFAGQGVNLGMQDALMVSRAIIRGANSTIPKDTLPAEIKLLGEDLYVRAKKTATSTNDMMTLVFLSVSSRSVIEKSFLRKSTFHDKTLLRRAKYPLVTVFVISYYSLFKL
jgi:2-polyprenyl-6-methoxyphenol hydroxylase-like FAD-dependent oxidoreductase